MNDNAAYRNIASDAGFTLIEILIAIAIFTIGFMAVGALQTKALRYVSFSQDKTIAMQALNAQVEQLKRIRLYATDVWRGGDFVLSPEFTPNASSPNYFFTTDDNQYQVSWWITNPRSISNRWNSNTNDSACANCINNTGDCTAPCIIISEDITVTVCREGEDPQRNALMTVQFTKNWATDN